MFTNPCSSGKDQNWVLRNLCIEGLSQHSEKAMKFPTELSKDLEKDFKGQLFCMVREPMALPRCDLSVNLQQIFACWLFAIVVYLSQQSLVAKQNCNEVKQKISWEENPSGTLYILHYP